MFSLWKKKSAKVAKNTNIWSTYCLPTLVDYFTLVIFQIGVDILGPFPPGIGQHKFLLVAVDYFMKRIEVEPLKRITTLQLQGFSWKSIMCRFNIFHSLMTYNGKQFMDKKLCEFYINLGIKHIIASTEHL